MRFANIRFAPVLVAFLLAAPLGSFAMPHKAQAAETAAGVMHKVVFQVSDNDPKKWNLALNNIKNVENALGKDKVTIELVAYGPGINMLKMGSVVGNRVDEAVAHGAKIAACENTMRGQHLTKDDMLSSISYVPAGVIEIMEKQEQGYSYIRP